MASLGKRLVQVLVESLDSLSILYQSAGRIVELAKSLLLLEEESKELQRKDGWKL
jgi:hypothetical protein